MKGWRAEKEGGNEMRPFFFSPNAKNSNRKSCMPIFHENIYYKLAVYLLIYNQSKKQT